MNTQELLIAAHFTKKTPKEASETSTPNKKPFSKSRKAKSKNIIQASHFGLPRHSQGKIGKC